MQAETKGKGQRDRPIVFKAETSGAPDKPLSLVAYLFDRWGRFLSKSPLKDNQAKFRITGTALRGARLFFGPELPAERSSNKLPTLETMDRLRAYEPVWRYAPGKDRYELSPIPEPVWQWWRWCFCPVRGQVFKTVNAARAVFEVPVCNARVHICEVDPLYLVIPRLPDPVIWRLRDEFFLALEEPPRPIPPEPGPLGPDLGLSKDELAYRAQVAKVRQVIGPAIGPAGMAALGPQPIPPGIRSKSGAGAGPTLSQPPSRSLPKAGTPVPDIPYPPHTQMAARAALPANSLAALNSSNLPTVRQALLDNALLIQPYLCLWPWLWSHFLSCDEVAVVTTDERGRFEALITYQCLRDRPDLYFWVEYPVDGVFTTVYRPRMHCHTYWNYECSSEVRIRVTDERVPGCWAHPEVIGKKVVVKSVGPNVSMGDINRVHLIWPPGSMDLEGTAKSGELVHEGFPEWDTKEVAFGGLLEPRVDFGNGLKAADITHYRWSYRPAGSSDESAWRPINNPLWRYYRVASAPGDPVRYKSAPVGPDKDELFEIDPALPDDGDDWEPLNEHYDLASARFDTRRSFDEALDPEGVGFGKVELKLELFRKSGGSVERIDLTDEGVELSEIITPAPFETDEIVSAAPTTDRMLTETVGSASHVVAYRLILHIDNRVCFGTINPPTIDGVRAGPCGFLEYETNVAPEPSVEISFRASHPGGFAAFSFVTTRVATDLPSASAHALVTALGANGFTRISGTDIFTKSLSVKKLLSEGVPPADCTRAAFAEDLKVYALVTNGYDRLRALDGPRSTAEDPTQIDVRAFAIVPEELAP